MIDTENEIATDPEKHASQSRKTKLVWIVTAVIALSVLGWEYRDWALSVIGSSGFFLIACLVMHFFMHRGHKGHR